MQQHSSHGSRCCVWQDRCAFSTCTQVRGFEGRSVWQRSQQRARVCSTLFEQRSIPNWRASSAHGTEQGIDYDSTTTTSKWLNMLFEVGCATYMLHMCSESHYDRGNAISWLIRCRETVRRDHIVQGHSDVTRLSSHPVLNESHQPMLCPYQATSATW
jgi:hypothetical protein